LIGGNNIREDIKIMSDEKSTGSKQSFWITIPGVLTAITGLIVAITGLANVIRSMDNSSKADPTPTAVPAAIAETPETEPTQEPEPTPEPTISSTEEVVEATATTESPTPTTALEHITIPDEPSSNPAWFQDSSSLVYADQGQATADNYLNMPLERPFTAHSMEYVGYVDITRVEISSEKVFVYISIGVEETPPQDVEVFYGVEIDADMDGRGDRLIYGLVPSSTDWTVEGVQIYGDTDNNVGGPSPVTSNNGISGNGYETLLFDSGVGTNDPDMAWIRRSPSRGNHIQFAFKLSVVDNSKKFLWSAWTDAGPMQPAWFDYNDYFTLEEAGSPISSANEYPLKELALVDSTCRWPYGFNPRGDEPGLCP
jgi:hypothetical protein